MADLNQWTFQPSVLKMGGLVEYWDTLNVKDRLLCTSVTLHVLNAVLFMTGSYSTAEVFNRGAGPRGWGALSDLRGWGARLWPREASCFVLSVKNMSVSKPLCNGASKKTFVIYILTGSMCKKG